MFLNIPLSGDSSRSFHSLADGCLGWFCLVVPHNGAMSMHAPGCVWTCSFISLRYIPENRLLGYVTLYLKF